MVVAAAILILTIIWEQTAYNFEMPAFDDNYCVPLVTITLSYNIYNGEASNLLCADPDDSDFVLVICTSKCNNIAIAEFIASIPLMPMYSSFL